MERERTSQRVFVGSEASDTIKKKKNTALLGLGHGDSVFRCLMPVRVALFADPNGLEDEISVMLERKEVLFSFLSKLSLRNYDPSGSVKEAGLNGK